MNGKKEFLTEENYERGRKKLVRFALLVLTIGILVGGSLIAMGIIKANKIKQANEQSIQKIEQAYNTRSVVEIQTDIDSIQAKIDNLENEISNLITEQNKIFRDDMGFSDRYYEKGKEIETKEKELDKLQNQLLNYNDELWKIESGYNDTAKEMEIAENTTSTSKSVLFYMLGGFIVASSCIISFIVYIFSKQREITAFTAQQIMPVAQEGIEKMAPTIGNAAETITKGITKGIKDGLKETDD